MATVWVDAPSYSTTLAGADHIMFRPAVGGVGSVAGWLISIVGSGTWSITVKARLGGSADTQMAVPYKKHHLNGAVGDATYVSTAITGNSLIFVPSEGMDVDLHCTSYTSGSPVITGRPVVG